MTLHIPPQNTLAYVELTISNEVYDVEPNINLDGWTANHLIIANDSRNPLSFSFNRKFEHGKILPKDGSISLDFKRFTQIFFKTSLDTTPSTKLRFFAWAE